MRKFLPIIFLLTTLLACGFAQAQNSLRIAAVINDEVISVYDLNERLSFVVASSQTKDSNEIRQRLAPQVLRGMIDEKLKLQEAKRMNIRVEQNEIANSLAMMEKANNLPKGGLENFLKSAGINKSVLTQQAEATIAWRKIINFTYRSSVLVSDEEIDEKMAEVIANAKKPEMLVAEIFLAVESPENEKDIKLLSNRLIQQLQSGAKFPGLARSFSQSATAQKGGDLGWIKQGILDENLDLALAKMSPGEFSQPIRVLEGYFILMLRERRAGQGLNLGKSEVTVSLQQLFFPLTAQPTSEEISSQMELAKTMGKLSTSCTDMESLGVELRSPMSGNLGKIKISKLPENLRQVAQGLPDGKASQPIRTKQGIIVIMICSREGGSDLSIPLRDKIEQSLLNQRLEAAAQRLLRDLRRAAFVDVRI